MKKTSYASTCRAFAFAATLLAAALHSPAARAVTPSIVGDEAALSSTATQSNGQRRSFYDASSQTHWVFYHDGTQLVYKYAKDGVSWTQAGTLAASDPAISLAYRVISGVGYVFLAAKSGADIVVRRGQVSGQTITFPSGDVMTWSGSGDALTRPTIALSSPNNVIWAAALRQPAGISYPASQIVVTSAVWGSAFAAPAVLGRQGAGVKDLALLPLDANYMYLLANGDAGNVMGYRYTGSAWELAVTGGDETWLSFGGEGASAAIMAMVFDGSDIYVGGNFKYLGGVSGANYVAKWNGSNWEALGQGLTVGTATGVTSLHLDGSLASGGHLYVGGKFDGPIGISSNNVARWDGTGWTGLPACPANEIVYALAMKDNKLYAGGKTAGTYPVLAEYDAGWTTVSAFAAAAGTVYALETVTATEPDTLYVGGYFRDAAGTQYHNIAAYNGSWSSVGPDNSIGNIVYALEHDGTNLYAGGAFTGRLMMYNNTSWTTPVTGLNGSVRALYFDGTSLYVGGDFTAPATRFGRKNGTTLDAVSGAAPSDEVRAIAKKDGRLYIGGSFNNIAGNIVADDLAYLDGSAWKGFGGADDLEGVVYTSVLYQTKLCFGGDFQNAGAVPEADYIACWDGSQWSALGTGTDGPVVELKVSPNDPDVLYVGGSFTSAGGVPNTAALAHWNGTTWSSIETITSYDASPAEVGALEVMGGNLYVGGHITGKLLKCPESGGGCTAIADTPGVAMITGTVRKLLAFDGKLYVGGAFMYTGTLPDSYSLVVYNGTNFVGFGSPFSSGATGVFAMATDGTDLYVGGDFDTAAGPIPALTKYNLAAPAWSPTPLVAGFDTASSVMDLRYESGELYVAGQFSALNGDARLSNIARYSPVGTAWSPVCGDGMNGMVRTTMTYDGTIYAAGGFNVAGGIPSSYISACGTAVVKGASTPHISALRGDDGDIHLAYQAASGALSYRKFHSGTWGAAELTGAGAVSSFALGSMNGSLMAAWITSSGLYYGTRDGAGAWPGEQISEDATLLQVSSTANSPALYPLLLWTNEYAADQYRVEAATFPGPVPTPTPTPTPTPSELTLTIEALKEGLPFSGAAFDTTIAGVKTTRTTDGSGRILIKNLQPGTHYLIEAPAVAGHTFLPTQAEGDLAASTRVEFAAEVQKFTITGQVLFRNAQQGELTINGGVLGTPQLQPDNVFIFENVPYGTEYSIRPACRGFVFEPAEVRGQLTADSAIIFEAQKSTFSLGGRVTLRGKGLAGVEIRGGGLGRRVTDSEGRYSYGELPAGTSYTLTPQLSGYTFEPASISGLLSQDAAQQFKVKTRQVFGGGVERISIASDGTEGNADSGSTEYSALASSDDGKLVAFTSKASTLIENDTNGFTDVFLRDVDAGLTVGLSVNANGDAGNADSGVSDGSGRAISMSGDGKIVAFHSSASNLVPNDYNLASDIFVYDTSEGVLSIVGETAGVLPHGHSISPALSRDGQMLAFASGAENLVDDDQNEVDDIFVRDLTLGMTLRASVGENGEEANRASSYPSLNGEGRLVVFLSEADNLVAGDGNDAADVFLRNLDGETTVRISQNNSGLDADGPSFLPAISADGSIIVFSSEASNLVEDDTNGSRDVFAYERATGLVTRISVDSSGDQADGPSGMGDISISMDGRYVVFSSDATNLVRDDTNNARDVFIHDLHTSQTGLASRQANSELVQEDSGAGIVSGDGTKVILTSGGELGPGDDNSALDVYSTPRGALPGSFRNKAPIRLAPTVVADKGKVTVVMQFFDLGGGRGQASAVSANAGKKRLVYVITVRDAVGHEAGRFIARRNVLTLRGLDAGDYSLTYHAELRRGALMVSKSKESPARRFSLQ